MKLFDGWLREHSPDRPELFAYYTRHQVDSITEELRNMDLRFREFSSGLEEMVATILGDHPGVLVYLSIGIFPMMVELGAFQMAPL